ncbi:hypothetical protein GH714_041257 [Hevea brasiliensis]|uniref:Uncharacterized protein n=1 Tax=Hevea brasiliensis TaxID=3981 RepID=A0A6A6MXR7_HEVBR|nr:hypothetical protein GH714_041257 [Hevea brasiliensis]
MEVTVQISVYGGDSEVKNLRKLEILRRKLEELGIEMDTFTPGQHNHLICPMCNGGDSEEKSFSLFISPDGSGASWTCFRAKCGWSGGTRPFAGRNSTYESSIQDKKVKQRREITVESLNLEPLCSEVVSLYCLYYEPICKPTIFNMVNIFAADINTVTVSKESSGMIAYYEL